MSKSGLNDGGFVPYEAVHKNTNKCNCYYCSISRWVDRYVPKDAETIAEAVAEALKRGLTQTVSEPKKNHHTP